MLSDECGNRGDCTFDSKLMSQIKNQLANLLEKVHHLEILYCFVLGGSDDIIPS